LLSRGSVDWSFSFFFPFSLPTLMCSIAYSAPSFQKRIFHLSFCFPSWQLT
jgi:hypothetical protein